MSELDHAWDYRVKRPPEFTATLPVRHVRAFVEALHKNEALYVSFPAWTGLAYVRSVVIDDPSLHYEARVVLQPSGPPCTVVTNEGDAMKDKTLDREVLRNNRFYVGSRRALEQQGWGHRDIKAAIAHAELLLEANDGAEQFIVKIIKVVRRKPTPIVVEDVK